MIPVIEESFELELRDSSSPMRMVRDSGREDWQRWKYMGTLINGIRGYRAKLIRVGACVNLKEVLEISEQCGGKTPSGLMLDSFYEKFPFADDNGPIVVGDDSWLDPSKTRQFPILFHRSGQAKWARGFRSSLSALADLHPGCRLLVELV